MNAGILAVIEQLLEVKPGLSIAISGAGGKTSLMRYLATRLPGKVICTTSTKLSVEEVAFFDRHILWESAKEPLPDLSEEAKNILITGAPIVVEGLHKLSGLNETQLIRLNQECSINQLPLIIEADGSKRRPLKAPADWEPVIPAFTDLVVVVVGLAGLMLTLNDENVFRSLSFAQLTGLEIGEMVDMRAILQYLKHPLGGTKGIPGNARRFVMFNLARCENLELVDRELIVEALTGVFEGVFLEDLSLSD